MNTRGRAGSSIGTITPCRTSPSWDWRGMSGTSISKKRMRKMLREEDNDADITGYDLGR